MMADENNNYQMYNISIRGERWALGSGEGGTLNTNDYMGTYR